MASKRPAKTSFLAFRPRLTILEDRCTPSATSNIFTLNSSIIKADTIIQNGRKVLDPLFSQSAISAAINAYGGTVVSGDIADVDSSVQGAAQTLMTDQSQLNQAAQNSLQQVQQTYNQDVQQVQANYVKNLTDLQKFANTLPPSVRENVLPQLMQLAAQLGNEARAEIRNYQDIVGGEAQYIVDIYYNDKQAITINLGSAAKAEAEASAEVTTADDDSGTPPPSTGPQTGASDFIGTYIGTGSPSSSKGITDTSEQITVTITSIKNGQATGTVTASPSGLTASFTAPFSVTNGVASIGDVSNAAAEFEGGTTISNGVLKTVLEIYPNGPSGNGLSFGNGLNLIKQK